ncbi:MAG: YeeE/YedE family protein [Lysobacter sp.]|nr:YeeE/YedE family protein [Lysobacter sp.]
MSGWMTALAGGMLIGVAATVLLAFNGRIAGVSGMVNGVLLPKHGDVAWRALFLLGLVAGGGIYLSLVPGAYAPRAGFPVPALLVAGLLVGFGTRMGNGCTSGHGVCGLGRLSLRSLAAVLTFMATAIATTFLIRHVWN